MMLEFENNKEKLFTFLERFRESGVLNHINGESIKADNKKSFENISPIDLNKICDVSRSSLSDVNLAVSSAKNAFLEWSSFPGQERKKILHNIAKSIEERAHEIALIESFDTGQSLRFMSKAALRGAANFRFFADQAPYGSDGKSTFRNQTKHFDMI